MRIMGVLWIKNMVCDRCRMAVDALLRRQGLTPLSVTLGEVTVAGEVTPQQRETLAGELRTLGFELIDDRRSRLVERVRTEIISLVHRDNDRRRVNLSEWLSSRIGVDYGYLSSLFSETQGVTVEKYYIAQKIERVKELLVYDELTLSEIADLMGYSSVAYLSSRFKSVTGMTPSAFKSAHGGRKCLDKL